MKSSGHVGFVIKVFLFLRNPYAASALQPEKSWSKEFYESLLCHLVAIIYKGLEISLTNRQQLLPFFTRVLLHHRWKSTPGMFVIKQYIKQYKCNLGDNRLLCPSSCRWGNLPVEEKHCCFLPLFEKKTKNPLDVYSHAKAVQKRSRSKLQNRYSCAAGGRRRENMAAIDGLWGTSTGFCISTQRKLQCRQHVFLFL